jgi:glycosyltransferase involved in cell wall biosynthesis
MRDPLVSILIPAYNSDQWVETALQSALAQTWKRSEIILVDDGSTDSTFEVARRYESEHVKVVSQRNSGASAARNHALSLAQGDFIQWLDADDMLDPGKIAVQLKAIQFDPLCDKVLSSSWGTFRCRPHKARFAPNALWQDLDPLDWLLLKMNQNLWMAIQAWLVPRGLSEKAGSWNTKLLRNNDGEYFDRIIAASRGVRFVPEAKSYVRSANFRSVSSQFNISSAKIESIFLSTKLQVDLLLSLEDSERTRSACLRLIQRWLGYFYPEREDIVRQLKSLAHDLGGTLGEPELPWKYRIVQRTLGWRAAKRIRALLPQPRAWLEITLDRLLLNLGR